MTTLPRFTYILERCLEEFALSWLPRQSEVERHYKDDLSEQGTTMMDLSEQGRSGT